MNKHESGQAGQAMKAFKDYVSELATSWYQGNERQAFRHAAFQQAVPDATLSDTQVIELTSIDKSDDLEIDGWFVDETSEIIFLFQAVGGNNKVSEESVTKFWEAPEEILKPERIAAAKNQALKELSCILDERLRDEYNVSMVFAARGGFTPSAKRFAESRRNTDRTLRFKDGSTVTARCSFELLTEAELAQRFDDFRAGFRSKSTDIELNVNKELVHSVDREGLRSLRLTISAMEIVRIFRLPSMGYRMFSLNPRGPIANAKVNKNIAKTLDTPTGRKNFHLLNNGLCAVCEDFKPLENGHLWIKNFQIVNGCQTTVTLNDRKDSELTETLIDMKLAVADAALAESIATASNSQTALKAKDYASFERHQKQLQFEFDELQPPWYYEIKQGYWRFVLSDREKGRYKTGGRKRHIEVQPLAQASLAFRGFPSEALDRIRFVFQGIRSLEDREWYERAFPLLIKANQLLLPWTMLDYLTRQENRIRFSTFHILWLIASVIKERQQVDQSEDFSPETSYKLANSVNEWMPSLYRVANNACNAAFSRAVNIMKDEVDLRDFFRASKELSPGVNPLKLLREAFVDEMKIERQANRNPFENLPD